MFKKAPNHGQQGNRTNANSENINYQSIITNAVYLLVSSMTVQFTNKIDGAVAIQKKLPTFYYRIDTNERALFFI